jgi:hypothetical protein
VCRRRWRWACTTRSRCCRATSSRKPGRSSKVKWVPAAAIAKNGDEFAKIIQEQVDALNQRGREGHEKRADREAQHTSHDAIKEQCETLGKQLSHDATRQYQFQIQLGCVTIDLQWIPRYASRLSDHTLQGAAHWHARQPTHLNEALHLVSPTPLVSFALITSMFGLNDSRTDNVCIRDNPRIVGPDMLNPFEIIVN